MEGELDAETWLDRMREQKKNFTIRISLALLAEELSQPIRRCSLPHLRQSKSAQRYPSRAVRSSRNWPSTGEDGEIPHGLCAIAMGKLATGELGFGGDLDVIFVYGQDGKNETSKRMNVEIYSRIVQRVIHLLGTPHAIGTPYALDTRLRPSGTQGTLVVSLHAFDQYHEASSQPWERQALMRAVPVVGAAHLQQTLRTRIHELRSKPHPSTRRKRMWRCARVSNANLQGRLRRGSTPNMATAHSSTLSFSFNGYK